jgi:hypothetical protein
LACDLVDAGDTYGLRGEEQHEGIALVEVFALRGEGDLTSAEESRIRAIVDEIALVGTDYDNKASLRDALERVAATMDPASAARIQSRILANMSAINAPECTGLNDAVRARDDVRELLAQRGRFLRDRIQSVIGRIGADDGWSATQAVASLPNPEWTASRSDLNEILTWYACRDARFRASLEQTHLLPLRSRSARNRAGSSPARVVVRFNRSADLRLTTLADDDYVFIATHVPRGVRPYIDVGRTQPMDRSVDAAIGQIALVFLSMGRSLRVEALVPHESGPSVEIRTLERLRMDPQLPPTAPFSTTSSTVNLPHEPGTTTVRICAADPCVDSGANANIRGSAVIEVEPLVEFMAIASLGAGFYVDGRAHELSPTGSGGPEQLYLVRDAASSTPLAISVGIGVRMGHALLSASLVSVGVDIDPFRSWLFGAGFRVPAFSRNVYLQFVAGMSRVQQFRELELGDVVSSPSGTTPSPARQRRRVPLLGFALSFDIAGSGEAISDFVDGAIP